MSRERSVVEENMNRNVYGDGKYFLEEVEVGGENERKGWKNENV